MGEVAVPPPVVPPRGIAGFFEGYDASLLLDTSQFPRSQVFLNVYDLGDNDTFHSINNVSTGNSNLLLGGMFHAGVQVYGKEWCFGASQAGSGVAPVVPRAHPQHRYRTTVPLGCTGLSDEEVAALLRRMSTEWQGDSYDLLHRNCLNFCNALCQELGVGRIPGWVDRAPRAASDLNAAYRSAAEGAREVAEGAREVADAVAGALPEVSAPPLPANAQDAQRAAEEALEAVRRETQKALEIAQAESARLAEAAQSQAQELADAAQPLAEKAAEAARAQAQELREAAQPVVAEVVAEVQAIGEDIHSGARWLTQQSQELLSEDVAVQARDLAEKTQAQARSLGTSLWSRAQAAWAAAGATATAAAAEVEKAVAEPVGVGPAGGWGGNWESTLGGLLGNLGLEEQAGQDALKCPQSHILRPWQARAGTCDGCGRAVRDGEQVMDCRSCDFYYCSDCVHALQGPPTSPAPAAPANKPALSVVPAAAPPLGGPSALSTPAPGTPEAPAAAPQPAADPEPAAAPAPVPAPEPRGASAERFSLSPPDSGGEEEDQE